MKKSILFVDDEKNILQGLRRMLYAKSREWELIFALSGKEALTIMDGKEIGVVISDMRMPGMNGYELLKSVREQHPEIIRIMLTGQPDKDIFQEVMTVSHYFLWKPTSFEEFKTILDRIRDLDEILEDRQLVSLIGGISSLPSLPDLFLRLTELLNSEDTDCSTVASVISEDMAMTTQILKLVNSAFFNLCRDVHSLQDAITYLGLEAVRSFVLVQHLFSQCTDKEYREFKLEQLWQHSFQVAELAKKICIAQECETTLCEQAYLGGLIHDIGKLIFSHHLPEQYRKVLALDSTDPTDQLELEKELLGASHAAIGGYLTSLWGLPRTITEAICFHHNDLPDQLSMTSPILKAVWHADRLCHGDERLSAEFADLISSEEGETGSG
ncbi:MAG: response regulator [Thermodesulfobacteriota bacterium]